MGFFSGKYHRELDPDLLDDEEEMSNDQHSKRGNSITCTACGLKDCKWVQIENKWVLCKDGVIHNCRKKNLEVYYVTCNRCNQEECYWVQKSNKWVLYHKDNIHTCDYKQNSHKQNKQLVKELIEDKFEIFTFYDWDSLMTKVNELRKDGLSSIVKSTKDGYLLKVGLKSFK